MSEVQTINGIEYVLIGRLFTENYEMREFGKKIEKFEGIFQSQEIIKGGWLSSDHMKINALIPSIHIFNFQ